MSTPVGESVVAKMVYRNCPIMLHNRVSYVELVELDTFDFDVIVGMDWLHACFDSIDCRTRVTLFLKGRIISCLKAYKMISKGC